MIEPAKTLPARNSHVVADQREVAAFLARARSFGVERVARIDTHGAMVFLAGERAYKIKRAVSKARGALQPPVPHEPWPCLGQ